MDETPWIWISWLPFWCGNPNQISFVILFQMRLKNSWKRQIFQCFPACKMAASPGLSQEAWVPLAKSVSVKSRTVFQWSYEPFWNLIPNQTTPRQLSIAFLEASSSTKFCILLERWFWRQAFSSFAWLSFQRLLLTFQSVLQAAKCFPFANWASFNYSHNFAWKGRANRINQIMRAIALNTIIPNTQARLRSQKINLKHYLDWTNVLSNKGKFTLEPSLQLWVLQTLRAACI